VIVLFLSRIHAIHYYQCCVLSSNNALINVIHSNAGSRKCDEMHLCDFLKVPGIGWFVTPHLCWKLSTE